MSDASSLMALLRVLIARGRRCTLYRIMRWSWSSWDGAPNVMALTSRGDASSRAIEATAKLNNCVLSPLRVCSCAANFVTSMMIGWWFAPTSTVITGSPSANAHDALATTERVSGRNKPRHSRCWLSVLTPTVVVFAASGCAVVVVAFAVLAATGAPAQQHSVAARSASAPVHIEAVAQRGRDMCGVAFLASPVIAGLSVLDGGESKVRSHT